MIAIRSDFNILIFASWHRKCLPRMAQNTAKLKANISTSDNLWCDTNAINIRVPWARLVNTHHHHVYDIWHRVDSARETEQIRQRVKTFNSWFIHWSFRLVVTRFVLSDSTVLHCWARSDHHKSNHNLK